VGEVGLAVLLNGVVLRVCVTVMSPYNCAALIVDLVMLATGMVPSVLLPLLGVVADHCSSVGANGPVVARCRTGGQ